MLFRSLLKTTALALLFVFVSEMPALAVQKKTKSTFGMRFGYYGGGTMEVDDDEYDTESGFIGGIYFDYPMKGNTLLGFTMDINEIVIPSSWSNNETSKTALQLALTLKQRFRMAQGKVHLRPGIGAGVGLVPKIYYVDNSFHFTFRATNDLVFPINPKAAFVTELGLLWDIHGSDGEHDMSGGPYFFLRGGFEF